MVGSAEEAEFLQSRVEELEQNRQELEQQLINSRNLTSQQTLGNSRDVASLQRRVREAEESEADALRAHESRLHEIRELQHQIATMQRSPQGAQMPSAPEENSERLVELQRQLVNAKGAEANSLRQVEEQAMKLRDQGRELEKARGTDAYYQQQHAEHSGEKMELERKYALAHQEKETHKRVAQQKGEELQESHKKHAKDKQEMERKLSDLRNVEDFYQTKMQDGRREKQELYNQVEKETREKESHQRQTADHQEHINNLEGEVSHLRTVETFHKRQSQAHEMEAKRLKRLRDQDAPPPFVPRMPLKALEERVMHLATFMMIGVCALPVMGAIALLSDENYVFWMGRTWPWAVIGGCAFVFVLFIGTIQGLFHFAIPEYRNQFTMAFTWATFAALLGVLLVPMALMANKQALNVAGTISQGCMTAMPQSELLVDYSQVLYNIRLSDNCTGAASVTQCKGFAMNKYTMYMAYLEQDFHCGPLCPESPPPARAVHAPALHSKPLPKLPVPDPASPPMFGPPLQNSLGSASFLQGEDGLVGAQIQLHEMMAEVSGPGGALGGTIPHMQAQKLFSKGTTRATCYPLIATRLQVLVSTFGGLWYWEGMGLIIISLLTSLYAGMYFALGISA